MRFRRVVRCRENIVIRRRYESERDRENFRLVREIIQQMNNAKMRLLLDLWVYLEVL
jgi:hypothetical protein